MGSPEPLEREWNMELQGRVNQLKQALRKLHSWTPENCPNMVRGFGCPYCEALSATGEDA